MASVVIPLTPGTNQSLSCTLPVDSRNITLMFQFTYNSIGGYWFMTVKDKTGTVLLDGVPLVTGQYPAANLLRQYQYLGIGSAYVVPASSALTGDPDFNSLGSDYVLVWSDTAA
ncbi:phage baseplate plug family protein [Alicyclobacillus macrosporangiidus]|uniref:Cyanophage baseplate Pam3 plug gp18 domain-containing protein n=1 Tax=Alicyclobacillus macrosporangiidus TaxID=392015 RepID=A0A1I7IEF2_9BACL|nr:hypothetical protein [Alicyclobacillus macrosporangiidus]SFU71230.1 hypothetical protein SAMN05421543_106167 [Alicyclobacillus macrosporangiidus]